MLVLPPPLAAMGGYRQFIPYRLQPSTIKPGKTDKLPVDWRSGNTNDAHDPLAWASFGEISEWVAQRGPAYGVGFVFSEFDPFWFLDIDSCLINGVWSSTAKELTTLLAGCAVEVSTSQKGLHLFGVEMQMPPHGCRNKALGIELYHTKRFVALTGLGALGNCAVQHPNLGAVVDRYFPFNSAPGVDVGWWSEEPVPEWRGPTEDHTLIERACRSNSAAAVFGGSRARFADLWHAEPSTLAVAYPPDNEHSTWNESIVDAALAQHLAFWTGNNAERIRTLMERSALVRAKWDREDYLPRTIRKACSMQQVWLKDLPPSASPLQSAVAIEQPVTQEAVQRNDSAFLGVDDQMTFFAGCVYVIDANKVMLPNGDLVDSARFNAVYGGHTFVMDRNNLRTVRKAFEAFTENQAVTFPRANGTCFRPLEVPGQIMRESGRLMVNTFHGFKIDRAPGDVSRFLDLMERMIPDVRDRRLLLGYMAGCVQLQGHKFQWAPLIQGAQGNGKTFLANCVKRAIGKKYVHTPSAADIDNGFNLWLANNTLYVVEEIYIEEKKRHIIEILKPMITNDEGIQIVPKGVDASTRDICGNFMFLTNWKEGLPIKRGDRRIAPFFCAQQYEEDLKRDGLTEAYFDDLIDWAKGRNKYAGCTPGYHHVADYLWTVTIDHEFNPAEHKRAPITSSREQAIAASIGTAEQEVMEAVAQEMPGFKGGFISSSALDRLFKSIQRRIPMSKFDETLHALGYSRHPALIDGRPNNPVMPDGGRPRLYVHKHRVELLALKTSADVAHAYSTVQLKV